MLDTLLGHKAHHSGNVQIIFNTFRLVHMHLNLANSSAFFKNFTRVEMLLTVCVQDFNISKCSQSKQCQQEI